MDVCVLSYWRGVQWNLNEKLCSLLLGDVKTFTGVTTRTKHCSLWFSTQTHVYTHTNHNHNHTDYFHAPWTNTRETLCLLLFAFAEWLQYSKGITLSQHPEAELTRWYRGHCVCMYVCLSIVMGANFGSISSLWGQFGRSSQMKLTFWGFGLGFRVKVRIRFVLEPHSSKPPQTWEKSLLSNMLHLFDIMHLHKLSCQTIGSNIECDLIKKKMKPNKTKTWKHYNVGLSSIAPEKNI